MAEKDSGSLELNMINICKDLQNVQYKAQKIGVLLGIDMGQIELFKKDGNVENVFMKVMDHWLKGNVRGRSVTWDTLVRVLEDISEAGLAMEIKKKYCQKPEPKEQKVQSAAQKKLEKRKANKVINDDSIKKILSTLIAGMKNGIPAMKIPPLDPLEIDDFSLEENSAIVTCQADFDSVVVTGLADINILSAKSENAGREIAVSASVGKLEAMGNYDLEGKAFFFLPLDCNGEATVTVHNASVSINISLPTQDNPEPNIEVSFTVDKVEAYFSNLLNSEDLGDVLNQLLNLFGKEIFDIAEPAISREVEHALEKLIKEELKEFRA